MTGPHATLKNGERNNNNYIFYNKYPVDVSEIISSNEVLLPNDKVVGKMIWPWWVQGM